MMNFLFRRLSRQIYLTIIVVLVLVVVIGASMWRRSVERGPVVREAFGVASELAAAALPPADAEPEKVEAAIKDLARKLDMDMALYGAGLELIAKSSEKRVMRPPRHDERGGFMFRHRKFAWAIALPDGRSLVAQSRRRGPPRTPLRFVFWLALVALIVGLGAWPVVRGLTRRLETLQAGVDRLGRGELGARVAVEGRDEIAALAESFNRSASRIETLINSHRLLLANASHELRTPLTRIRMALELIREDADPKVRENLARDICELDDMIEEILLLSRLDAGVRSEVREPVDLLALLAEECVHYQDCDLDGTPVSLMADPQLLRRVVRNLLENAAKHGAPPIRVRLEASDGGGAEIQGNAGHGNAGRGWALLRVSDHGEGISPVDRERVFEPFHRGASRGRSRGSGLGLALVREIVAQHGGSVAFTEGEGGLLNTLLVRLPRATSA